MVQITTLAYIGDSETTSEDMEMQIKSFLVMFALVACDLDDGTYGVDAEEQEVDNAAEVRPTDEDAPEGEFILNDLTDEDDDEDADYNSDDLDLSSDPDPAAGFGCPGNDYECHNHCKSVDAKGGYCSGFLHFVCKCYY